MTDQVFHAIVSDYVERAGPKHLAVAMKLDSATVMRWSRGSTSPHPRIQQKVVDWIWEQVES